MTRAEAAAHAAKAALRSRMQAWRRRLRPDQLTELSARVSARLAAWAPLAAARCVLAYRPLRREPQIGPLLGAMRARGVRVVVPRVVGEDLELRELSPDGGDGAPVPPDAIDVALVPGLAFDGRGGRLGRGGGHYDRLLPQLRPDCERVGVCFAGQVVDRVPRQWWDAPVDWVATEEGIRRGAAGHDAAPEA